MEPQKETPPTPSQAPQSISGGMTLQPLSKEADIMQAANAVPVGIHPTTPAIPVDQGPKLETAPMPYTVPKPTYGKRIVIGVVAALLITGGVGYVAYANRNAILTVIGFGKAATNTSGTNAGEVTKTDAKTLAYKNTYFSVEYPSDWKLESEQDFTVNNAPASSAYFSSPGYVAGDSFKDIDQQGALIGVQMSALDSQKSEAITSGVYDKYEKVSAGGLTGYKSEKSTFFGTTESTIQFFDMTAKKEYLLTVKYAEGKDSSYDSIFDKVVTSFKVL